jgi:hypothetical protein
MANPPKAPDAVVFQNPPFGFGVAPPVVPKHPGGTFTILNATNVTVRVSFPVLSTNPAQADILPQTREDFIINPEATRGSYDYRVQILAVTEGVIGFDLRASAASDPRILID